MWLLPKLVRGRSVIGPLLKRRFISTTALRHGSVSPVCIRAEDHLKRIALVDQNGVHTYEDLLLRSRNLAAHIHKTLGPHAKEQQRIAFICPNDFHYVVAQWATWLLGHTAVPLGKMHPTPQLEYYAQDSDCSVLLATPDFVDKIKPIAEKRSKSTKLVVLDKDAVKMASPGSDVIKRDERFYEQADAMFLYTSGTTGAPKGVVITHANLEAQLSCITQAWRWTPDDKVLHILPLHHVHGVVYLLLAPLYMGAKCVMLPKFDPVKVWQLLLDPPTEDERVNILMGVPTVYVRLNEEFDKIYKKGNHEKIKQQFKKNIRLVVSGSASLPEPVFERWTEITGSTILERYGMSEIGLALANPIDGPCIKGCVGNPLPTVQVCIARDNPESPTGYDVIAKGDDKGTTITPGMENESGELYIRGPSIFREYWRKPEATQKDFTKDGWFKTGDTVQFVNPGTYKIMGRTSVDIIKSGGYKISALDVETVLLSHPDILEVTVVGIKDATWGQRVAVVAMLKPGASELSLEKLRAWCRDKLPPYSIPSVLKVVPEIPRNILGKVNKKELVKTMFP